MRRCRICPSSPLRRVCVCAHPTNFADPRITRVPIDPLTPRSRDWAGERCGGRFIWCDPLQVLEPEFNALTIFSTTSFSRLAWAVRGAMQRWHVHVGRDDVGSKSIIY